MIDSPVITLDVDWAPDFVLEKISSILKESNVKSTWFVTHDSPIIQQLQENSLFEIGIHPNFHPSSTQGKNFDDIMKNLKRIVPEAKSLRSHDLYQTSSSLKKYQNFDIENDVSLLLEFLPNLIPFYSKFFNLYRFPFFWEDDVFMTDTFNSSNNDQIFSGKGMKILNFHPIHIFLNSSGMENYNLIKQNIGMQELNENNIEQYIQKENFGTLDFFKKNP